MVPYTNKEQLNAIEYVIKKMNLMHETYGLCWYFQGYHKYLSGDIINYGTLPILFPDIFDTSFAKEKLKKGIKFWWNGKTAYRNRIRYLNSCKKKLNETNT